MICRKCSTHNNHTSDYICIPRDLWITIHYGTNVGYAPVCFNCMENICKEKQIDDIMIEPFTTNRDRFFVCNEYFNEIVLQN